MKYRAIIWDCDGVLIDSEVLACTTAVEVLEGLGHSISLEEYLRRFMGKSNVQICSEIRLETGLQLQGDVLSDHLYEEQKKSFIQGLQATPGVHHVLKNISVPMAIASGSSPARLQHCLEVTKLAGYFNGHLYSSEMVKRGKPAPNIFLYAAKKMGIAPKDCLVIEDGIHGLQGAKTAGMDVFAYTGGSHMNAHLKQNVINAGANAILSNMNEMLPLLHISHQNAA